MCEMLDVKKERSQGGRRGFCQESRAVYGTGKTKHRRQHPLKPLDMTIISRVKNILYVINNTTNPFLSLLPYSADGDDTPLISRHPCLYNRSCSRRGTPIPQTPFALRCNISLLVEDRNLFLDRAPERPAFQTAWIQTSKRRLARRCLYLTPIPPSTYEVMQSL